MPLPGLDDGFDLQQLVGLSTEKLSAITAALAAELCARLLKAGPSPASEPAGGLVTAPAMARFLNVHESWVRSQARAGLIPCIRVGRFVRFDPGVVTRAIEARPEASKPAYVRPRPRRAHHVV
jgi:hypothetical protein